jgi:hypothetical protein
MTLRLITIIPLVFAFSAPAPAQSLRERSTDELTAMFVARPKLPPFFNDEPKDHSEAVLQELVTRGNDALRVLNSLREPQRPVAADTSEWSLAVDLALLTAIRSLDGKHPPLKIRIPSGQPVRGTVRDISPLPVEITNVDADQQPVWFTFGGDYRSGRLARWRIHVWDQDGNQLPAIPRSFGMGGGVYFPGMLKFGESDERILDIPSYVRIREPGTYTAQLMYHDSVCIADIEDAASLDRFFLVHSDRFELVIEKGPPIEIALTRAEYELSKELIAKLNFNARLKLIASEYGSAYHSFIRPDSAHGKLLNMGYRAVPALLKRLQVQDATYRERAWILGLLHSIMHERYLSPTDYDGAIDSYECRSLGGSCSARGSASPEAQAAVVEEWLAFAADHIKVREIKQEP